MPAPSSGDANARLFWFLDHVLFDGRFVVLAALAFAPVRRQFSPRWLLAAAAVLLMLASFLQFNHPALLILIGVLLGGAYKQTPPSDQLHIVLVIAGLGLGIPLSGFTGLMIAKANFDPNLVYALKRGTGAIGSTAIAGAYLGLYSLIDSFAARGRKAS